MAPGEDSETLFKGEKGDPGTPGLPAGQRKAIVFLFVLIAVLAALALFIGARQVSLFNGQLRSQCGADKSIGDVAQLPVTLAADGKASPLGIRIISANRAAWRGLGCSGSLAKPSASYVHWADFYHFPAN